MILRRRKNNQLTSQHLYLYLLALIGLTVSGSAFANGFYQIKVGDIVVVTAAQGIELHYFNESVTARGPLLKKLPCPSCVPVKASTRFAVLRKVEPPCYEISETNSRCEYNLVVKAINKLFPIRSTAFAINALSLEGATTEISSASPSGKTLPNIKKWFPLSAEDQVKACEKNMEDIRTAAQFLSNVTQDNQDINRSVQGILDIIETSLNMIQSERELKKSKNKAQKKNQ